MASRHSPDKRSKNKRSQNTRHKEKRKKRIQAKKGGEIVKIPAWVTTFLKSEFVSPPHWGVAASRPTNPFFTVQRLLAVARSFNTCSCMLLRNSKLANYCIHIAAFWLGATKVNWYGTCTLQQHSKQKDNTQSNRPNASRPTNPVLSSGYHTFLLFRGSTTVTLRQMLAKHM